MFIAADINKRALKRKQSQLQFTQILKSNALNQTTALLKALEASAAKNDKAASTKDKTCTSYTDALGSANTTAGAAYIKLQAQQTEYDMAVESTESQLKLIDAQITSLDKLVQNNISQDATLWCVGGS